MFSTASPNIFAPLAVMVELALIVTVLTVLNTFVAIDFTLEVNSISVSPVFRNASVKILRLVPPEPKSNDVNVTVSVNAPFPIEQ